jgi:hypothetical protein
VHLELFYLLDAEGLSFSSVLPTRYFLGRPDIGEEMHISIEKGKMLIIRLMAIGPVIEGRAQREVWFEVNGEVSILELLLFSTFLNCFRRFVLSQLKIRIPLWRQSQERGLLRTPVP